MTVSCLSFANDYFDSKGHKLETFSPGSNEVGIYTMFGTPDDPQIAEYTSHRKDLQLSLIGTRHLITGAPLPICYIGTPAEIVKIIHEMAKRETKQAQKQEDDWDRSASYIEITKLAVDGQVIRVDSESYRLRFNQKKGKKKQFKKFMEQSSSMVPCI